MQLCNNILVTVVSYITLCVKICPSNCSCYCCGMSHIHSGCLVPRLLIQL